MNRRNLIKSLLSFLGGGAVSSTAWSKLQSTAKVEDLIAKKTRNFDGYFESIAEMRASTGLRAGGVYKLLSYHSDWDSTNIPPIGGGTFIVSAPGTTATDNGGTIILNAADQVCHRVYSSRKIHSSWFGAKGDGITPDQNSINAAIKFASTLLSVSTGNNKHIGGAEIILFGNHYVTGPISMIAPSSEAYPWGGLLLVGEGGGATLTSCFSPEKYSSYNEAVIKIGAGPKWASSFGSTTWRSGIKNIKLQRRNGVSTFGIIGSGLRDCVFEDIQTDGYFVGCWIENTSECRFTRWFDIGSIYGIVLNGRYNHNSPLGFTFDTNDVSNNNFTEISGRNNICNTILQICSRQNRFIGGYSGLWGSGIAPKDIPPHLALPTDLAGIHVFNNIKGDTYGSIFLGFIFEAIKTSPHDAIKITVPNKAFPTHGLQFNNCYLQVYSADYANQTATTLFNFDIGENAHLESIVTDNCGVRYQDANYLYPRFVRCTGNKRIGSALSIRNIMCPWMLTTSNAGGAFIDGRVILEKVNMEDPDFLNKNWKASNSTYITAKVETGKNGVVKAFSFTGNNEIIYIEKTFNGSEIRYINDQKRALLIQFSHSGDTKPYINLCVNDMADTDSDIINGNNLNRYGNVLVDYFDLSGTRTVLFRPFSAVTGFDSLRIRIGRAATAMPNGYTEISNIIIGYIDTSTMPYLPTENK